MVAPLVANFLQMRGDSAVFIEDGSGRGIWSIHINDISKLESSSGEKRSNKSYIVRYATYGGSGGLVLGVLFASVAKPSDKSRSYDRVATALIGGVVGGAIGAGIGTRVAKERWAPVVITKRLTVVPLEGGARVGLSFSF